MIVGGFNNLSYTIRLRQDYVVAPMDQEILEVYFMMYGVQQLWISPLGAQFTKMAANGSEKVFCVLTFHGCRVSYNCPAAIPHQIQERTTI